MNLTWKWGQGRRIPSVRLLSHQMISPIHANYSEWKLIKRNYVSANEDLGLCPSYNIICSALPAGYLSSPLKHLLWLRKAQMPFILDQSTQNHAPCVIHKLAVIGWAIKTSVSRTGEGYYKDFPEKSFPLNQVRSESKLSVWEQIVPFCKISFHSSCFALVCPNDVHTAALWIIRSSCRTEKLAKARQLPRCPFFLPGLPPPPRRLEVGEDRGLFGAGPLTRNCWAVTSASIWMDWGCSRPRTQIRN